MTSVALAEWNSKRASRIALAWQMHSSQAASTPDGWQADQALGGVLQRMATEFQGFCRALHDAGSEFFAVTVANGNSSLESTQRQLLTNNRSIDRGNAQNDSIAQDFSRFGFMFWQAMKTADPRAESWQQGLIKCNQMRNAVAHDDESKMKKLISEGYLLDASTVKTWHVMLDDMANVMDEVVSLSLSRLLGVSRPW